MQAVRVVSVLGVLAALAAAFWFMAPRGATTETPAPAPAAGGKRVPIAFTLVPTIDDRFTAEPCNRVAGTGLSALNAIVAEQREHFSDAIGVSMGDVTRAWGAVGRHTVAIHYTEVVPQSGVRFVVPGEGELATGVAFIREILTSREGLTFLCGNAVDADGNRLMHGTSLLKVGERGVLLVGVAADSLQEELAAHGSDVRLDPAAETAARACAEGLADARAKGIGVDVVALFVHGTVDEAAAVLEKVPGVTFAAAAHGPDMPDTEPRRVGDVPIYYGGRGLRFAWRVVATGHAKAPASFLSRNGARAGEKPSPHAGGLALCRDTLKAKFFEGAATTPGDRPRDPRGDYVGGERCSDCHAEIGAQHAASPHGVPSKALLDSAFGASTSCVGCHTTAPYWDGGWRGPKDRSSMAGVSCEACHGPGQAHAASQSRGYGKVEFSLCLECHVPDRSPGFDPAEAWKRAGHRLVR